MSDIDHRNTPGQSLANTSVGRPLRRQLLAAGLGLAVAACGRSSVVSDALKGFQAATFGGPDLPLTRDQIANLPYASIRARVGKGPDALMILGRVDGPDLHWVSADRIVFATRNGRIVKTANLPLDNVRETRFGPNGDPVTNSLHLLGTEGTHAERFVDFQFDRRYGTRVVSRFDLVGEERLIILDLAFDCVLVRESGRSLDHNWQFENRYWAEASTGFVWKSMQSVTRDLPPISIEVLKAAA